MNYKLTHKTVFVFLFSFLLLIIIGFSYRYHDVIVASNENLITCCFGNNTFPYSDPLGPWLSGALDWHFTQTMPSNVVRPFASLYLASVYNLTGIYYFPYINLAILFLNFIALAFFGKRSVLIWTLLFMSLLFFHYQFVIRLYPQTLATDFPSLVFTLLAVLYVFAFIEQPEKWGFLCISAMYWAMASTIRGTQLGAAIFLFIYLFFHFKAHRKYIFIAFSLFLVPFIIDSIFKNMFDITPFSGFVHEVYSDPESTGHWKPLGKADYMLKKPSTFEVLKNYLNFVFLEKGYVKMLQNIFGVTVYHYFNFMVEHLFCVLVSLCILVYQMVKEGVKNYKKYIFSILHLFVLPFLSSLLYAQGFYIWYLVMPYLAGVILWAFYKKHHYTIILFAIYFAGLGMLSALYIFGVGDRTSGSVEIFFVFAFWSVILEPLLLHTTQHNTTQQEIQLHCISCSQHLHFFVCIFKFVERFVFQSRLPNYCRLFY